MVLLRASDLRMRDVINVLDGKKLGTISDLELDVCSGKVTAVIVPGLRFFGWFGRGNDYIIPWERIKKVGPDVVLVELPGPGSTER